MPVHYYDFCDEEIIDWLACSAVRLQVVFTVKQGWSPKAFRELCKPQNICGGGGT